ncbi:hypothetical protein BGZ83_005253 [Gryganskiella cystojenkinii]|nr:hypothetical protein BGZ83_005253 [Gryganskiella cystojenkinii]
MPNYVSLTESQRRKIAVFITESQQQAQMQQQQLANADDAGSSNAITTNNSISCKEIVQFCKTRFGLTISLSTASRLRSTATERLSTELLNPSAKRHRSVKFPEFEKALVQELKALELEQLQIQQEQHGLAGSDASGNSTLPVFDQTQLPPVMTLTSEAAITQVAKGIAERMGISDADLGLTSGWYHGFKRRHGIKHRQFKSRSGNGGNNSNSSAVGGLGTAGVNSINSQGTAGGSNNMMDTRDDSEEADNDEEMEDAGQDTMEVGGGGDNSNGNGGRSASNGVSVPTSFDADPGATIDPGPTNTFMDMRSLVPNEGMTGDAGSNSMTAPLAYLKDQLLKDQLQLANMVLSPRETSTGSPNPRRPEVKKVMAATANDALDVISEYLLQNGQIGATKLPLVKELRKFLLAQTEIENGLINGDSQAANAANSNGLLLSVGVSSLAPVSSNADAGSIFVNSTSTISTHTNPDLSVVTPLPLSHTDTTVDGTDMVPLLEQAQRALNLPSSESMATMAELLSNHQRQQQLAQQQQQLVQQQQQQQQDDLRHQQQLQLQQLQQFQEQQQQQVQQHVQQQQQQAQQQVQVHQVAEEQMSSLP